MAKEMSSLPGIGDFQEYFSFPIASFTRALEFEPEEFILGKDEKPGYLYYLVEGRAKVFLPDDEGRHSLIDFIESGHLIGELELIGAREQAQSVQALTRCRCFALNTKPCRQELLADVVFLRRLCLYLGKMANRITYDYVRNQAYPLENRLAGFILLTMHRGMYTEQHTEAAKYLGVSYRHLLYVLADFRKRGILERTRQGYRVLDEAALQKLKAM